MPSSEVNEFPSSSKPMTSRTCISPISIVLIVVKILIFAIFAILTSAFKNVFDDFSSAVTQIMPLKAELEFKMSQALLWHL